MIAAIIPSAESLILALSRGERVFLLRFLTAVVT